MNISLGYEDILLGRNNDDKGTQLEILTKRILMQHGLTNVMRDEVGLGLMKLT